MAPPGGRVAGRPSRALCGPPCALLRPSWPVVRRPGSRLPRARFGAFEVGGPVLPRPARRPPCPASVCAGKQGGGAVRGPRARPASGPPRSSAPPPNVSRGAGAILFLRSAGLGPSARGFDFCASGALLFSARRGWFPLGPRPAAGPGPPCAGGSNEGYDAISRPRHLIL